MLRRSTIQLLRFHFSLFLLPVYLFALSQANEINWRNAVLSFIILHLLVYPASNGYNSYMDRDETPIGGLASPLQPTKQLFYATVAMDVLAVMLSLCISPLFAGGVLLYILASRAYSYRGIRLKKYPVIGFLTVFIFQGALVFFISYEAVNAQGEKNPGWIPLLLSSLLIGALYPLTQIYQHEEDKKDGVTTISCLLGKRGTFVFSMTLFLLASLLMYFLFKEKGRLNHFTLFLFYLLPVVLFFLYWMNRVWKDGSTANFKNSLRMNLLSTLCTAAYFITLIILNH
ncbi:UbiA family prenyltransferase [Flavisolibacter ginsenosidimutans]|uniref:Prenyltransferase n=1 Tax=Flavisolibacter ginsenosidimutans TaxID=661481 RepID=A0A5B8UJ23_9BACT|nr:UbiA family prenyltransferase [Flavisolibacter ginsenosidimutans]QEC56396.1 prenyltransferase [Flavisolibacter ginsenosidimutans]